MTTEAPVKHVVLIIFDTLRRDAVGCYGTPPPWGAIATPNLDAFRKAAAPLHNDAGAGAGWTKAQYDRLQAIK